MAEIKHGTAWGYDRCRAENGEACRECKDARASHQQQHRLDKAARAAASFQEAIDNEPVIDSVLDELWEARENLRLIRAAMRGGKSPRDIAALSKQRMDLVARIKELEVAYREGESVVSGYEDEIGNLLRPDFGDPGAEDRNLA